jgi:biopolymer transport protein ExbB
MRPLPNHTNTNLSTHVQVLARRLRQPALSEVEGSCSPSERLCRPTVQAFCAGIEVSGLKTLALGLLAALTLSGTAHAWWNGEWTLRKKFTLDTTATGAAIADPIGTTPVLVRLHDGNFRFTDAKPDGADIRFVAADDKTLLPYHIEKFDSLLNEAFVWVKIPDTKPGTKTSFWLYYGNSGNKAARADDAKGTYDADTVLVYHFAERGSPANDSSGAGNSAQNAGVPVEGSLIGSGLRLDGKSAITVPSSPSLAWTDGTALTWSAWIKPAALQPNAAIFSRRDGAKAFVIGADNGVPFVEVNGTRSAGGAPIAAGGWHHLAVVVAGLNVTLYLDGESYATLSAALPALNTSALIGANGAAGTPDAAADAAGFVGEMDELEISRVARQPGFIKLAAFGQGGEKAAKLLTFGEDEQPTNWMSWMKGGYVGVILNSLSVDGWVVIGILIVMACISWFVMITKASYINAVSGGNGAFLKNWGQIVGDLGILDDDDFDKVKTLGGRMDAKNKRAMRNSSVYRIYHIGVEEIRRRLAADQRAANARVLSARSIQAIRASLDGGLVRETQKLNRAMVLLTIAISGGPFLGLLGTVVGVMITFAAVAAAGDVNVNAIAPGIAAALAATVAGLAVAIPSLFGYNYLVTRIKEATADMHVFIDEFVTKMAEFYSESEGRPARQVSQPQLVPELYATAGR